MLVLDDDDAIRGIAEVIEKLDFTVNGYVGTTATQLADGQMHNAEADLYQSGANATVVTSITIVNTDSVARTFTLYLKPNAGTSRAISPVSLDLGVGHCFLTDGQRMIVMDLAGQVLRGWTVDDTAGGTDGLTEVPISSNVHYDHCNAADPHIGYMLESLLDDKGDGIFASGDNAPAKVAVGANDTVLTAASGETAGVKWAAPAGASNSGTYTGDSSVNRAIAHGLGVTPKAVFLVATEVQAWAWIYAIIRSGYIHRIGKSDVDPSMLAVTAWTTTNFYVGNAADYDKSANLNNDPYYWVAFG